MGVLIVFAFVVLPLVLWFATELLHRDLEKDGIFYDAEYDCWFRGGIDDDGT